MTTNDKAMRDAIEMPVNESLIDAICNEIAAFDRGSRYSIGCHVKRGIEFYVSELNASYQTLADKDSLLLKCKEAFKKILHGDEDQDYSPYIVADETLKLIESAGL